MRGGGSSRKEKAQSWMGGGWAPHRRVRQGLCHPDPGRGEGSTATPASPLQSHKQSALRRRHLPRVGDGLCGCDAPPCRRGVPTTTYRRQGAGRSHPGKAGGAGVARRCPRGRRRRAAGRPRAAGPEAGPTGGAAAPCSCGFPRACNPAARSQRRQVSAICSHSGGGGGGGGRRRAEESWSRALRNLLCSPWWTGALPASAGDSPPRGPASAVLICPQFSGFSSPERLRPLHLEDLGGFPGGCSVFFSILAALWPQAFR